MEDTTRESAGRAWIRWHFGRERTRWMFSFLHCLFLIEEYGSWPFPQKEQKKIQSQYGLLISTSITRVPSHPFFPRKISSINLICPELQVTLSLTEPGQEKSMVCS